MSYAPSAGRGLTTDLLKIQAAEEGAIAFNPNSLTLDIDHASYLAQHDLVYNAPPVDASQAVAIGNGDVGARLWCPGHIQFQLQKSDLWADPPMLPDGSPGPAGNWEQVSAGTISLHTLPALLDDVLRYEQRLSLLTGIVTISAAKEFGTCHIESFISVAEGVLVIRYRDQSLRSAERRIEFTIDRSASVFAGTDTIGILQKLRDRRCALVGRIYGKGIEAQMRNRSTATLEIASSRSGDFTFYAALAITAEDIDPVGVAKSRLQSAMVKGYDQLVAEQKRHWSAFWQKSFLRLTSPDSPEAANYVENLWYLNLYNLACCSQGIDAPLPNGALWLADNNRRRGAAIYEGSALRQMAAPALSTGHPELIAPYSETLHRMLTPLKDKTRQRSGHRGVSLPSNFNRHGASFGNSFSSVPDTFSKYGDDSESGSNRRNGNHSRQQAPDPARALGEGLDTALFVWDAWRYHSEPNALRQRVYPLISAVAEYCLDSAEADSDTLTLPSMQAKLAAVLRALAWASHRLEADAPEQKGWLDSWKRYAVPGLAPQVEALQPFGKWRSAGLSRRLCDWLESNGQGVQGFMGEYLTSPDMRTSGEFGAGVTGLLLREEGLGAAGRIGPFDRYAGFGGTAPSALRVFPMLPDDWSAVFTLMAPGGVRVTAEAVRGKPVYVALQSRSDGVCRLLNPWKGLADIKMRGQLALQTDDPLLTLKLQRGETWTIEQAGNPIERMPHTRLRGKPNLTSKTFGANTLGIAAVETKQLASRPGTLRTAEGRNGHNG